MVLSYSLLAIPCPLLAIPHLCEDATVSAGLARAWQHSSILEAHVDVGACGLLVQTLHIDLGAAHPPNAKGLPRWAHMVPRWLYGPRLRLIIRRTFAAAMALQLLWALWSLYTNVGVVHRFVITRV